jgi:hypothetical protein
MGEHSKHNFIWAMPGTDDNAIDVSSYGKNPYKQFSPFYYDESFAIPVPGQENMRSHSVEGIWQGLKVIDGTTDFLLFKGKPHKRKGNTEGHLFGNDILGYIDARKQIYVPAYLYHVINHVLDGVKEDLEARIKSAPVVFHDVETNEYIDDDSRPYSHAALLVRLLNFLKDSPLPPFNKKRFNYFNEQVEALLEYRFQLKSDDLSLCDDVITFAYLFSPDELKATFALRAIKKGNIDDKGRLDKL